MRLRIVGVLAEGGRCVCDLHEQVPVAANLLSYHLRVLRDAGLVTAARRGRWVDYRLDGGGFAELWAQASAAGVPLPGDRVSADRRGPPARTTARGAAVTDTRTSEVTGPSGQQPVVARLSRLDRFLPVWIGAAMVAGLLLGRLVPGLNSALNRVAVHGTSLPIALGLLLMMYPVLAKVRYNQIGQITADRRMMTVSLLLNWVVGPAVMFTLAWLLLADQPAYRTGVILVGLARCIAMVLIWTDLACGDREMATVLVALNAVFQVLLYAALGYFYLQVLPGWLGLATTSLHVSIAEIAGTVAVFLGIPLVAGYLTRTLGERARGRDWYEHRFLPRLAPVALYGLLFTVVILFALQGKKITSAPLDVARIALPLLAYFAIMWAAGFAIGRRLHLSYPRTVSLAFSAASNDFELAIAVAIGVFGVTSGQALAGVVGPLIEVPVMLALVYVALWARRRFYPSGEVTP